MPKLDFEKMRRNLRVSDRGGEPVSQHAGSGDFLINPLLPTKKQKEEYLKFIRKLMETELNDTHQCEHWFPQVEELHNFVPIWDRDDQVSQAVTALKIHYGEMRRRYDQAIHDQNWEQLVTTLKEIESSVAKRNYKAVSCKKVGICVELFEAMHA
ncbi:MAG: hypothetical protein K9M98_07380 [Cephaloticoccus sp.]|nr:hypothetical protein [Cephaloticoccus sp.]MCF7760312.1 hypothetical protein [Cephaloticoccus sp.]